MEKFLTRVAATLVNKHGNNMSDVLILMPSHRSCTYLREELKLRSAETLWSPEILTFQDWIFDKSELALIEPLEQVLVMHEVYKSLGGDETFDEFISTAQIMLSDFDEVDRQLVNAKSFFTSLEQLQSMKVYEPGDELSEYSIRYKRFWQLFRELYFGLREKLIKEEKGYEGMLFRNAADRINAIEVDAKQVYFIGFNYLNKAEERIFEYLRIDKGAEMIWDTDEYYVRDQMQEAGYFFRHYSEKWRVKSDAWRTNLIKTDTKNINVIGVAKNIGQTKVVADILMDKLQLGEGEERQTAIIVPDEKLLKPLLQSIPSNISALNISMGYPLRESAVADLLNSLFSLHEGTERLIKPGSKPKFYFRDVFDLLHHPYSIYLVPDKKLATDFIAYIRTRNRSVISFSEIEKKFTGTQFEQLFWFAENANDYLNKLLETLDALRIHFMEKAKTEESDLKIDIELLFHVTRILNNLHEVIKGSEQELTPASLRKLIKEDLRSAKVPFDGEPVRGLQVLGMLETICLDFKNVIILSMNEGIYPVGKSNATYVPFEMRREFLTTHREKDATAAYLFYRLLQRAENIFLLYNTESDELGGGEKSRFILQLQHELPELNYTSVLKDLVYSVDPPPALPENVIVIKKDAQLLETLVKGLGDYGLSPSALNTYINCTLQYYFRYAANLRETDDVEENIEAATLGLAVHYVLENVYKNRIGGLITPDFIEGVAKNKAEIERLLNESFAKRFDTESLKQGKNYLLYRVCLKLINDFFKQEQGYLQNLNAASKSMKLVMLENKMEHTMNIAGHEIKIAGRVDRVEECDEVISIADYKTGTPVGSSIKADDIALFATDPVYAKAMQLLTYGWLYWKSTGAGDIKLRSGIYWMRDIKQGLDTLKLDKTDIINAEILGRFETVLQGVLTELLNPEIPFKKTDEIERCAFCEFKKICMRD